uniref:Uncharacterized protein n=1 Tax=Panagrolaimus superbus TaxID=310955 RepID=A0A914Y5Y7_9BILA
MSKKQIKQKAQLDDDQNVKDFETDEESEEEVAPSKRVNKFALLEDEDEDTKDSDKDSDDEAAKIQQQQPSTSKKQNKKKNNKKKNKQKEANDEEKEDWKEFAEKLDSKTSTVDKMAELLKVSFSDLNADSELKRFWGQLSELHHHRKKPEWPSAYDSGLSVTLDDSAPKTKKVKYYRFEHNAGYKEAQQMFWDIAQIPGADFVR